MKITLEDELKTYLKEHHHDALTLKVEHNGYSASNSNEVTPEITYHTPHDLEEYNSYTIDDVKVYVGKNVRAYNDQLDFVLETLLGIHGCTVKGLNLDNLTTM